MTRRILSVALFVFFVALAAFFTWLNPGRIDLDLGFAEVDAPVSVAFVSALAIGWLLGLASAMGWLFKRRRARRRKEKAERKAAEARSMTVLDERG